MDLSPLWISLKVAVIATICTFLLGIIAARVVMGLGKAKVFIDAFFSLTMVLPPTVVGFFLLLIFGKNNIVGKLLTDIGIKVLFTWQGAVIAAVAVSFPIMYRTVRGAFEQIDINLIYAAKTLGMTETEIFIKILLPMAGPGVIAATILSFARALGEFGATIMIAGNIPGKTQTISVAIYTAMQSGDREKAALWVVIIMSISFIMILLMNCLSGYQSRKQLQKGRIK